MFLMISILFVKRNSKYLLATLTPIAEHCYPAMCDSVPEPFSFSFAFSARALLLKHIRTGAEPLTSGFFSREADFFQTPEDAEIRKLPFVALQTLSAALFTWLRIPVERKVRGRAGEQQHLCLKGRRPTTFR